MTLRLDLPGNTAIVANKPNESELMKRVKSHDADRMPPKGTHSPRSKFATLETWIREGAIWPKLDVSHTTITPLADDATFLRRAYLDTLGVVPTLDESQAFLANPSPNKRRELIDRLLADPALGRSLDVVLARRSRGESEPHQSDAQQHGSVSLVVVGGVAR